MKKITLLLFAFFTCWQINAQVSSYAFSQSNGTYMALSAPTILATQTATSGTSAAALDDVNYTLALPFDFNFAGVNYVTGTNIYVNTNGFVSFGATAPTAGTYGPIGSTNVYDGALSAFGLDANGGYAALGSNTTGSPVITITSGTTSEFTVGALISGTGVPAGATVVSFDATQVTISANCTSTGTGRTFHVATGQISYGIEGVSPNRKLIIQYTNLRPYNVTQRNLDFQIVLNETSNVIDFIYGSSISGTTSSAPQVGLRGSVNTSYLNRTSATSWSSTTAGTSNTQTVTFLNTVLPTSGLTFTWTPPVPCSGVPTAGSVTPAIQNICSGTVPATIVATGFTSGVTGLSFQWEESNDDGVTDVWQNAVGGTGATTSSYIPPAFSGTTIYYRLKVTCTNSGSSSETASVSINPPATPSNQVTLLTAGTVTLTTIPLSWTNGNGNRRVVYFSNSPVFVDPVNGNGPALTANTVYAGSGQQIVFDGTGTTVTVTGLTQGTTYYAKVYEYTRCGAGPYDYYYNVTTGTNIITVATQSAPANDNFANAAVISCGNTYTGSTVYASLDEDSAPDGFGADMDAPNVWFSFTGSGTAQTVTLDLCASSYDSSVLIYTGTSGALTLIGGNDDDASCTNGTRSKASFNSDGTTTYYIAIEGWNSGSTGAYSMTVSCVAVNPPAVTNQDCGTSLAVNVDGVNVGSDNSYGTVNATQPSCDSFGSIQDVWFSFQAPTSGLVDCAVTVGSMTSGNFTVYSGTCATLTETTLACNSNFTGTITENLTGLVAGNTYYVQVWSNASEQGTFIINLSDPSLSSSSFDNNAFTAYPNPVKDILNLSYTSEISNVQVVNMLGQVVLDRKMNATEGQINMSGLNSGAYIVNVTVGNTTKSIKVIKQ
ncbi:T9SS type A sorting domain-containing protein [Flavobacterium lacisediminis]|uniref:T9SS type A sorting domain-containing protein n=1 Tax=Flavobacterium lacisediminis TaxID=2989705 RepID=A0ABT3EIA4_9FLAO|nr:T9SS type A sorting domain-containing protein [Flavobacterium lacisediminis]MCW1148287.1 T9SS type A sorting domain-containing protein [Flavobacterium lacisediminis]